jgi:hypothetical protein
MDFDCSVCRKTVRSHSPPDRCWSCHGTMCSPCTSLGMGFKEREAQKITCRVEQERLRWKHARTTLISQIDEDTDQCFPVELIPIIVEYCLIACPSVPVCTTFEAPNDAEIRYCPICARVPPPALFVFRDFNDQELLESAIELFQTSLEVVVEYRKKRVMRQRTNDWIQIQKEACDATTYE